MSSLSKKTSIFVLFLLLLPVFVFAQTMNTSGKVDFGGKISFSFPCTCSGGYFLMIEDYLSGSEIPMYFQPGYSSMKSAWNIYTPGVYTLGDYIQSSGSCYITVTGQDCEYIPTEGIIAGTPYQGIGTGAIPASN